MGMSMFLCRVRCSLDRTRFQQWCSGSPALVGLSRGQDMASPVFPAELG